MKALRSISKNMSLFRENDTLTGKRKCHLGEECDAEYNRHTPQREGESGISKPSRLFILSPWPASGLRQGWSGGGFQGWRVAWAAWPAPAWAGVMGLAELPE